jgi:hypothetical protein
MVLFLSLAVGWCDHATTVHNDWQTLYANEEWYRSRAEPERTWQGRLETKKTVEGPNSRTAVRFALITTNESLSIYAPTHNNGLRRFVGRQVRIRGKLVDLSGEGYGKELWPGFIAPGRWKRRFVTM